MKRLIVYIIMCLTATVTWAQDVVIDRLVPGRLGITVLQQVNSFDDVRSLTIRSGKMSDNDLNLLQNDFRYLRKIDLGGLDCEIFPNGNMVLEGTQSIWQNKDEHKITFRGICRQDDILANNTIPSTKIADATVRFNGKGPLNAKQRQGILTQIFNILF